MQDIKKEIWIKIASQIYIDIEKQTLIQIEEDWRKLASAFEDLKKIDVSNLEPTDYPHKVSMNTLRDDVPVKQSSDYYSKKKYIIE
jgi:Asp-tRNA(Asn)/Glu-tRNA(Gln) amidotransferase C subunit